MPTNEAGGPRLRAALPLVFVSTLTAATAACAADPDESSTHGALREQLQGLRYDEEKEATDPSNRFVDDPKARALGQRLFFDPAFSGPLIDGDNDGTGGTLGKMGEAGKVSCASCHVPRDHFVDTRSPHGQISLAAMWTPRRTPTLLDVAFAPLFNWDGRRDSLWGQAIGVMESHAEFNSGRLFVATQVVLHYRDAYEELFGSLEALDDEQRFPRLLPEEAGCREVVRLSGPEYVCRGKPGDDADYDALSASDQETVTEVVVNVAKSMSAYVSELRCGSSRFDLWLDGDESALDEQEVRGAALFAGKAGCVSCHSGPLLTDGKFHNVGMAPFPVAVAFVDSNDRGAAEALPLLLDDPLNTEGNFSDGARLTWPQSQGEELEGAFRTPTLRCIAEQPSFMHTGQFKSLRSVVEFFSEGGHFSGYPGSSELTALNLSREEIDDVVAFILALQGPGPDADLLEEP